MRSAFIVTLLVLILIGACVEPVPKTDLDIEPSTPNPALSAFMLVDRDTSVTELLPLEVSSLRNFTIEAIAAQDVASVLFFVDDMLIRTENVAPYTVTDASTSWKPGVGTYTIRAVPYADTGGQGAVGDPLIATITVLEPVVAPPTWVFCAWESEYCSFEGTAQVRYGADGTYVYGTHTGGVACSNDVFGDPAYGVRKSCEYAVGESGIPDDPPAEPVDPDPQPEPSPPIPEGIRIAPNENAVSIVSAQLAGTTFVFEPGVHRLTNKLDPQDGDVFYGMPGAVLSGARVLTSFEQDGSLWYASGQTQQGWRHGECRSSDPRCNYPEDFFIDDVPLRHVASKAEVVSGTYYFDYDADRIYFADNPAGRVVETTVVGAAISGAVDDVTVTGLVVEKFGSAAQRGAIMADFVGSTTSYGERWIIENNTVRLNHGLGIRAGHGARIVNNKVIRNGQMGIGSSGGSNTLIEGNEIAYNNFAGYSDGWEAGGTKFSNTIGLVVRDNHVHHNDGPGLWTDINNYDTLYEENLVEHNEETGIFHEISYDAIIRNNVIRSNGVRSGEDSYAYVFGAGILIYSSSNVEVYGNEVLDNWNGITALQHDRGTGDRGRWEIRNVHVHDNTIRMGYHPNGRGPQGGTGVYGVSGVAQAGGFDEVFSDAYNNRFERNDYELVSSSAPHFTWENAGRTFASWQSFGQDVTGSMS